MRLALIAILWLSGPQGSPQLPRTPQHSGAPITKQNEAATTVQENPKLPPPSPSPAAGKTDARNSQGNDSKADENIDIQRKLSKYTFWLVVGAFITAGVIGWQSWESRKAAEAAARNTEILVNIERPWVIVDIGKIPEFTPDPSKVEVLWISPTFENKGRTAARLLRYSVKEHLLSRGEKLPPEPQYALPVTIDLILAVDSPMQPASIGMNAADFLEIWPGNKHLYVYGFVDYLDSAGRERQTRFCYRLIPVF